MNKNGLKIWIKVFLLFILRVFTLGISIKLIYFIITLIEIAINYLLNFKSHELPYISYVNLICFGISVAISLKTTYYLNGVGYKILSNEFGFKSEDIEK
jgi:hypothetical protein